MEKKLILKTQPWMADYAKKEIKKLTGLDTTEDLEVIDNDKDFCDMIFEILYYSRTLHNIEIDSNKVFDFDLTQRDYKVNTNEYTLNPLVAAYLFEKLELPSEKEVSVIDPVAHLGDMIIEAKLFTSKVPLNVKKRHSICLDPSYKPPLPEVKDYKGNFVGVVQDNLSFKKFKENVNLSGVKVKMSQYDLEWLDSKFQRGDFDYVISYLPDDDFIEDYLYQAEFICNKRIGLVCDFELEEQHVKQNNLKEAHSSHLIFNGRKRFVYVLEKK